MLLTLPEICNAETVTLLWKQRMPEVWALKAGDTLTLDADGVKHYDGSAEAVIIEVHRCAAAQGFVVEIRDAASVIARTLKIFNPAVFADHQTGELPPRNAHTAEQLGEAAVRIWRDIIDVLAFLGEVLSAGFSLLWRPGRLRLHDTMLCFERAGMDALPIIGLIGFLIGLILAFLSGASMKQFGVEVYVADLISIGLFREMGALITAIILAGRTGSAFAAELGTMKVNEEIDALTTLSLPPVTFLALPRVIASTLVLPFLSIFAVVMGLFGGFVVLWLMDIPAVTYWQHVFKAITVTNVLIGLVKALTFGLLVGLSGCSHGLYARRSADAVGQAATASVVGSLVLITVFDGIFSVLCYVLNI
jgi:phospholipid/cholesterol/gamma-HCH transport system permease protein